MPRKTTKQSQPASGDPLRDHLQKVYTLRPRASKYTGPRPPFNIAEQDAGDTWEWRISLGVRDTDPPVLPLSIYAIALNDELASFVRSLGGTIGIKDDRGSLTATLCSSDTATLRQLAGKIRAVATVKLRWLQRKVVDALTRLAARRSIGSHTSPPRRKRWSHRLRPFPLNPWRLACAKK